MLNVCYCSDDVLFTQGRHRSDRPRRRREAVNRYGNPLEFGAEVETGQGSEVGEDFLSRRADSFCCSVTSASKTFNNDAHSQRRISKGTTSPIHGLIPAVFISLVHMKITNGVEETNVKMSMNVREGKLNENRRKNSVTKM